MGRLAAEAACSPSIEWELKMFDDGLGVVTTIAIVVSSIPVSLVLTLWLVPLWRWIERVYGLESLGHSGPAEWCYLATYALCVVLGVTGYWLARRGRPSGLAE